METAERLNRSSSRRDSIAVAYVEPQPKGQLYDESGKIKMEPIGILHMLHLLIVTSFVLTSAVLLSKLYFSLLREV